MLGRSIKNRERCCLKSFYGSLQLAFLFTRQNIFSHHQFWFTTPSHTISSFPSHLCLCQTQGRSLRVSTDDPPFIVKTDNFAYILFIYLFIGEKIIPFILWGVGFLVAFFFFLNGYCQMLFGNWSSLYQLDFFLIKIFINFKRKTTLI